MAFGPQDSGEGAELDCLGMGLEVWVSSDKIMVALFLGGGMLLRVVQYF